MPRARKTRPTGESPPLHRTLRFVEVPTSRVLRISSDDGEDVGGAFVRLVPRLTRSERQAFDAGAAVAALMGRGALAAVALPEVVPDRAASKREDREHVQLDARGEVEAWFRAVAVASDPEDAAAARDICLGIVDEVGL